MSESTDECNAREIRAAAVAADGLAAVPTEELRARARQTDGDRADWGGWTRDMLLAFFRNRRAREDRAVAGGAAE